LPKYLEEWKVLRWAVAFLQKYCYKWHPRKCIGLDMANLIIFNLKNGENGEKSQNLFFFHFLKIIHLVSKMHPQKQILMPFYGQ
jgi:hypothetical protein